VARRVCDLENLVNHEAIARVGLQRHIKKVALDTLLAGVNNFLGVFSIFIYQFE
jgi:hypothetical protein